MVLHLAHVNERRIPQGEYCRGCTVGDQLGLSGKAPNAQVILDVDRKAFADRLVESMKFYGEGAK